MTTNYNSSKCLLKIEKLAFTLYELNPSDINQLALISIGIGALFSLKASIIKNYDDRKDAIDFASYSSYIKTEALKLSNPDMFELLLLNEYYFNSALLRISILNERLNKELKHPADLAKSVRLEANRIKHNVIGVFEERHIGMVETIDILEGLILKIIKLFESKQ